MHGGVLHASTAIQLQHGCPGMNGKRWERPFPLGERDRLFINAGESLR